MMRTLLAGLVLSSLLGAAHPVRTPARGVNLAGPEFGTGLGTLHTTYTFNSEKSYRHFSERGLTLIRVPIKWERIQPVLGGPLDPQYLGGLKQNVSWAKAHGCRIVIDLHNYGRYSLQGRTSVIDNAYEGEIKVSSAHLAQLWTSLSAEFKGEPAVYAYGLMNEPHEMGTADWKAISQAVVAAIRKAGDTKLLLVPGTAWSSATNWAKYNGPRSWIDDPAGNFKYEAHVYFDRDRSGAYKLSYDEELAKNPELPNVGAARLADFTSWCAENGVGGFLGEYAAPNTDPRWLTVLENFLTALDAAGMDWTYWAGGEWWGSYPCSVQPREGFTVDAPQMDVLRRHLGAAPR